MLPRLVGPSRARHAAGPKVRMHRMVGGAVGPGFGVCAHAAPCRARIAAEVIDRVLDIERRPRLRAIRQGMRSRRSRNADDTVAAANHATGAAKAWPAHGQKASAAPRAEAAKKPSTESSRRPV